MIVQGVVLAAAVWGAFYVPGPTSAPRKLVLRWDDAGLFLTLSRIELDGAQIFPARCSAWQQTGLCSPAHRWLRGLDGRGWDLRLVAARETGTEVRLLFAATVNGNSACSLFGYWTMRVNVYGVHIGEPVTGCFLPAEQPSLQVQWSPLRIRAARIWASTYPTRDWVTVPWRWR